MKVIILSGPTASGKTTVSLELAREFNGEIVNFDSLLLYRELLIGTAKPTLKERGSIPHHMIDVRSINDPMNAAQYADEATNVINDILKRKNIVVLVGGSGFYLQALLKGMYNSPTTPREVLERSQSLYDSEGIQPFLKILRESDPESFRRYHENDHYRVRRAVEHWWANGTPFALERSEKDSSNQTLESKSIHDWETLHLHLDLPKDDHQKIIEDRTHRMIQAGLEKEVRDLLQNGFTGEEKPLQSIGYKEMLGFISGEFSTIEECQERIVISTRQLAKSQRTWFKKDESKTTFHPRRERDALSLAVKEFLKS